MSDDLLSRLAAAATAGEILRVVYRRGSQPGTVREIAPVVVSEDEVRALDLAAGIEKTFKLASLELVGPETTAPDYQQIDPADNARTLTEALEPHVAELQGLGWHVETADTRIAVHGYFKNGKPKKGADVAVLFREFSIDAWDDGHGWREEAVRSARPFYVSSPTFERARTFARLAPALALFLEEARRLAPGVSS